MIFNVGISKFYIKFVTAQAIGILPLQIHGFSSWRVFILLNTIPSLLAFTGLVFLPESPKFLLTLGKNKESLRILNEIYYWNTGGTDAYPVKFLSPPETLTPRTRKNISTKQICGQFREIFAKERIWKTINFCSVIFAITFVGFGTYMWLPITISYYLEDIEDPFDICTVIEQSSSENRTFEHCEEPVDTFQFLILVYVGLCFTIFNVFISQMIIWVEKKIFFREFIV